MKCNPWTLALISAGVVSLPAVTQAEEKPSSVLTALSSTTLSGYVDTSAQWNINTGNQYTPQYAFGGSSKADGFNLNVVELRLEKPVDAADAWGAGYKLDLLAGPDANSLATQSFFGNGNKAVAGDFAVKQAYVALHAPVGNGLDFKVGVWDTIIGYEVFESINDPNVTRSYGYTIEPTTHTGIQAAYQFCEYFSATVGVANTFGPAINERANPPQAESFKAYMGSLTFTAPTNWGAIGGSTLTGCVINGFDSSVPTTGGGPGANQTSFYVGATLNTGVTGLKVGASYDYLSINDQPLTGSEYANAVAVYASYQLTEKLGIYGRGEYGSTDIPGVYTVTSDGPRDVWAATATAQYDLWKNVLSRLEFRWDYAGRGGPGYGGTPGSEDLPSRHNSFILLADFAYKF
jgi:hypothetical protein